MVHYQLDSRGKPDWSLFTVDMSEYGYALAGPAEFEFTPPKGFDPITGQVQALERKIKAIDAQAELEKTNLRRKINDLLMIGHSA